MLKTTSVLQSGIVSRVGFLFSFGFGGVWDFRKGVGGVCVCTLCQCLDLGCLDLDASETDDAFDHDRGY